MPRQLSAESFFTHLKEEKFPHTRHNDSQSTLPGKGMLSFPWTLGQGDMAISDIALELHCVECGGRNIQTMVNMSELYPKARNGDIR